MTKRRNRFQLYTDAPVLHFWTRTSVFRFLGRASLILLSLFYINCGFAPFYATGKKIDNNRVTEIVEQRTTRDEILIMFGSPLQTNLADPNRASWWRYGYTYLGFLVVEQASLEIYFTDNLVDYYLFNVDRSRY